MITQCQYKSRIATFRHFEQIHFSFYASVIGLYLFSFFRKSLSIFPLLLKRTDALVTYIISSYWPVLGHFPKLFLFKTLCLSPLKLIQVQSANALNPLRTVLCHAEWYKDLFCHIIPKLFRLRGNQDCVHIKLIFFCSAGRLLSPAQVSPTERKHNSLCVISGRLENPTPLEHTKKEVLLQLTFSSLSNLWAWKRCPQFMP